jgi:pimeloyl-ACP methyl ester carboxylesterase
MRIPTTDGASIAIFVAFGEGPPLLLLHGTAGDHTTFRVIGPTLEATNVVYAMDRRGRGASTDGPADGPPYDIAREFEDVASVAEVIASNADGVVDVFGHSYGGRCALGAALRTDAIRRVISYEGGPAPPGASYHDPTLDADLRDILAAGDPAGVLSTFMRRVVGMTEPELDAYRADPVWPKRVAAAPTIVRELAAEASPAGSLDALAGVRQPVLQILGGASLPVFRDSTLALDERLADGRIVEIPGAKHAAHHTHPDAVVDAVTTFLRD